jgi:hypothetical protein
MARSYRSARAPNWQSLFERRPQVPGAARQYARPPGGGKSLTQTIGVSSPPWAVPAAVGGLVCACAAFGLGSLQLTSHSGNAFLDAGDLCLDPGRPQQNDVPAFGTVCVLQQPDLPDRHFEGRRAPAADHLDQMILD